MTSLWVFCLALGLFSVEGSALLKERHRRSSELCSTNENQDWRVYGNSCYLVRNRRYTYDEAMADCGDRFGAVVSTINDEGEFNFIKSITTELLAVQDVPYWIGADDRSGQWAWADGSQIDYSSYAWGQPNSTHGHCLVVAVSGLWRSNECNKLRRFVCEKSIGPRTVDGDVAATSPPPPPSDDDVVIATPEPTPEPPIVTDPYFTEPFFTPEPTPEPPIATEPFFTPEPTPEPPTEPAGFAFTLPFGNPDPETEAPPPPTSPPPPPTTQPPPIPDLFTEPPPPVTEPAPLTSPPPPVTEPAPLTSPPPPTTEPPPPPTTEPPPPPTTEPPPPPTTEPPPPPTTEPPPPPTTEPPPPPTTEPPPATTPPLPPTTEPPPPPTTTTTTTTTTTAAPVQAATTRSSWLRRIRIRVRRSFRSFRSFRSWGKK